MRIMALVVVALLAACALAAIETQRVPLEDIKGAHWDFQFKFRIPQRVVLAAKDGQKQAYWVLPYTVTNTDKVAHEFVPSAVMFTDNGKMMRDGLYPDVVAAVKKRYDVAVLKNSVTMMGPLKAGEDEAQDGIFVFPEKDPKMDNFKLFVTGLSGEFVVRVIPSAKEGQPPKEAVLRKTMQLEFDFPGDEVNLESDQVYLVSQKWIWR